MIRREQTRFIPLNENFKRQLRSGDNLQFAFSQRKSSSSMSHSHSFQSTIMATASEIDPIRYHPYPVLYSRVDANQLDIAQAIPSVEQIVRNMVKDTNQIKESDLRS